MNQTAKIITHYLEEIVKRAGLTGFDEMRAEIESAADADEEYLRTVERLARGAWDRSHSRGVER